MNIKWENLFFLPFMPAYWTAKYPWVGIFIGAILIVFTLYFLRKADYYKKIFPFLAGIVWIIFGIYEFSIYKEYREYWELVMIIPVVYIVTLIGCIQLFRARKIQ